MKGKKRFIKLESSDRSVLENGRKNGKKSTFRQRCHYILLSDQGKKIEEIAEIYQVNRQTVVTWFDRYQEEGIKGLETKKGKGRPSIIKVDNEAHVTKIEGWVEENSQNLNVTRAKIENELGLKVSKRTLQRFLEKKTGYGNDLGKKCLNNLAK